MKRFAWIVAATVLAGGALLTLLVVFAPRESLRTRLGQQIAAWTGREVSLRGEPELDFFPALTVTLRDVQVGGPAGMADAPVISMERLKGTVRLVPLVIGRVEIASFTMVRPLIRLVRDAQGARNWTFDSGAAALQLAFAGDVLLGDFAVEDGTVVYENRQRQVTERLDSVHLGIRWPSIRQRLAVTGSGIWRGEQVSLSASADAPFDFLNGDTTAVQLGVQSSPISMDFTGAAADVNAPQLQGTLSMTTPSLRGFAGWLGSAAEPGSRPGPASLSGKAVFKGSRLSVVDAQLGLDGNNATGALEIVVAKKPQVFGTLALPSLDLTSYFAAIGGASGPPRSWRDLSFSTDWFRGLDADIRLSAASVAAGPLRLGQTAASVSLRDASLQIGIAQASFYGGTLGGDVAIGVAAEGRGTTVKADLRASNFDLSGVAPPFRLPQGTAGMATVSVNLASAGADLGGMIAGLTGTGRIDVGDGSMPLLGIAEIAAPPREAGSSPSPTSPVDSVFAGFSFSGGTAILEQSRIAAPGFTAEAKGWTVLADGSLGLNGTVQPAGAPAPIRFTLDGTLAAPVARPLALAN